MGAGIVLKEVRDGILGVVDKRPRLVYEFAVTVMLDTLVVLSYLSVVVV